ncbi:MAG TPA: hypothetical protein VJJ76_02655 [archaeon]|nr:hypothetical protein [archaeon]
MENKISQAEFYEKFLSELKAQRTVDVQQLLWIPDNWVLDKDDYRMNADDISAMFNGLAEKGSIRKIIVWPGKPTEMEGSVKNSGYREIIVLSEYEKEVLGQLVKKGFRVTYKPKRSGEPWTLGKF